MKFGIGKTENIHMEKIKEIDTIDIKKTKITCIERKYKITDSRTSYIVTAKRELDESVTRRLLHEDMELKTFLANYEITSVSIPVTDVPVTDVPVADVPVADVPVADVPVADVPVADIIKKSKIKKAKPTSIVTYIRKERSKMKTFERRELFDSLDLPEEFTTTDYEIALEQKGVKVTNPVMANDDFDYFLEAGKIERTGNKIKQGRSGYAFGYRKIKADENIVKQLSITE